MPLQTIPVLSEDHPLFDWADWPSSREALVSGTPTRLFAKEAWNAIVDSLNDALTAAGLEWDSTYTTAEGAKITVAYGKLTAKQFNSVRHNIDRPAPLGWAWADRTEFRGYIGRADFKGRQDVGKRCDKVYAEYIIELARKLDLLLELMRGTALIADGEAELMSALRVALEAFSRKSAPVSAQCLTGVDTSAAMKAGRAACGEVSLTASTRLRAALARVPALPMEAKLPVPVSVKAKGESKRSVATEASLLIPARTKAALLVGRYAYASGQSQSRTGSLTEGDTAKPQPVEAGGISATATAFTADRLPSLPMEASASAGCVPSVTADKAPAMALYAAARTAVRASVGAGQLHSARLAAAQRCAVTPRASLDTAWYPPVWVDGGLWIRQSHSVSETENGELVIA